MKKSLLFVLVVSISLFGLNPRFHSYPQIKRELDSLKALYPQSVHVESIGVSLNDHTPIWAVKLSDNASTDEDEPAVMFAGQVHAEEVLGVEISLHMIKEILDKRNIQPYKVWLQQLEMWFVPSYNPEGLSVVMSGADESYRKNKRDNNNNGILDFVNQPGGDIDGVDMNRNYGFNWIHGDSLYCTNGEETYDYYRGPAAFSEGETQAIKNLAEKQHFIYSINWHSSRTGSLSEKLFYSFEFATDKQSPDFDFNKTLGDKVASLIAKESGTAFYEPSPSRGRNGSAHDWFYQAHGTVQFLIECGTANLQPAPSIVDAICVTNSTGAYHLLNRVLGYNTDGAMLTGHVKRSDNQAPLDAEIIVLEKQASYFAPRLADSKFGRFFRPLMPGTYNIKVRKKGFVDQYFNNFVINNSQPTNLDVSLVPLPAATVNLSIKKDGVAVNATVEVAGEYPETIIAQNGSAQIDYFAGNLQLAVFADGCTPVFVEANISAGTNQLNINLKSETLIYGEEFTNGFSNWESTPGWQIINKNGVSYIDDSPNAFYADNSIAVLKSVNPVIIPATGANLAIRHDFYVEHDYDKCLVEASQNGTDWDTLKVFSGISEGWRNDLISLADYKNKQIYLRLRVISDVNLNDPGWKIDRLRVYKDEGVDINNEELGIRNGELFQNYPNPFNNSTMVSYQLSANDLVQLSVYNVKGELVKNLVNANQSAGKHSVSFKADGLNSGVYYIKMQSGGFSSVQKCLMVK